jgi:hypothetical protein
MRPMDSIADSKSKFSVSTLLQRSKIIPRAQKTFFIDQGRTVQATVEDTCPGCGQGSIDLTPAAFQQLASLDAGRIQVTWNFI